MRIMGDEKGIGHAHVSEHDGVDRQRVGAGVDTTGRHGVPAAHHAEWSLGGILVGVDHAQIRREGIDHHHRGHPVVKLAVGEDVAILALAESLERREAEVSELRRVGAQLGEDKPHVGGAPRAADARLGRSPQVLERRLVPRQSTTR